VCGRSFSSRGWVLPTYRDLELAVEKLSQLLEEEIKPETIKELRQNTLNKTVCVLFRMGTFLRSTRSHRLMSASDTRSSCATLAGAWRRVPGSGHSLSTELEMECVSAVFYEHTSHLPDCTDAHAFEAPNTLDMLSHTTEGLCAASMPCQRPLRR
jgi:hypothetical protein